MPNKRKDQLRLGAFISTNPGTDVQGAWRYPLAEHQRFLEIPYYVEIAQSMERGKFDFLFFADSLGILGRNPAAYENYIRIGTSSALPDPLLIVSAIAGATKHLGLAITLSTSYQHPFTVARSLATLDYLSNGRAAWNVVTSQEDAEARNFGLPHQLDHTTRYERADEFIEAVLGLWDTWEDDAVIFDQERNIVIDPKKVHPLKHHGKYFQVEGPLNMPRPPQGHAVIAQPGSSETGREFAARWSEVMFTPQPDIETAKVFYADLKSRLAKFGREESDLKILPGVVIVAGETESIARAKEALLFECVDMERALVELSGALGKDLSGYLPGDLAEPILTKLSVQGSHGQIHAITALARKGSLTLGQLARRMAAGRTSAKFVGTGSQIADQLQEWFEAYACDGFMLRSAYNIAGIQDITRLVIPELRKRGLVRTEYTGKTLRENLGLKRPERATWRRRLAAAKPG